MLRRNSSRKKNRRPLSRSKSTNSVARSPIRDLESINPARAERDANIAAVVSYQRAQDRDSSEGMLFPRDPASFYPDRSDGTGSIIRHSLERTDSALSGHGSSNIARQKSVRFTGPLAHPRRNFAPRANGGRDSPTKATSAIHAFGNANARPSPTLSFQDERPDNFSLTRRYLETLQLPDSCYHPEEDAASMAATYKKVRKSRSMVTSSHAETGTISSKTWSARTRQPPPVPRRLPKSSENEQLKPAMPPNASLRASTSMSFLKTRRRLAASRSSSRGDDHDLAVQLAREKFRQIQEQDAKKSQSPTLLRPKHTQSENSPFRKSMRNSSNHTAVSALSTISASKQRGIRKTARKVSHGLRSRLRGLFGRGKSSEDSDKHELEQVAAENDSDAESCLHNGDVEATEEASMFHVTSHVPSLHDVPSNQQLRSRKGSVESLGDGDQHIPDDKSRVTSWTNSMTNTVTSHGTTGDWERQRLSVIKENGTHIPSSARSIEYLEQQTRDMIADMSVDSERVYSALMERLARKEPTDRVLQSQPGSVKSRVTNTGDSNGQSINRQWDCSTIRCVRPDDNIFRDNKDHSSRSSSSATEVPEHKNKHQPQADHTSTVEHTDAHTDALDWSDDRTHSESERTSVLLQGLEPHKTITQRSSAFFASPSCQSFRSPSPYRRALRASQMNSEEEQDAFQGSRYLHSLSTLCLPTRQDSSPSSGKDLQVGDAESVYSCVGDDANPVLSASENTAGQNETCIYNDPVPPLEIPARLSYRQHQRDTSTASSVEWKTWLSSKVSQLEAPLTPSKREKWNDVLPTLGHVREHASIGSTPEHFTPTKDGTPNRSPLSNVKGNAQIFQGGGSPTRSTRQVLIGYDENAAPSYKANTYTKGRPPSIPPRSTLRAVPSLPSVGSRGYIPDAGLVKEMPRMRSLNTIGRLNSTPEESINKRRSRTRVTGWQASPTKSSPGVRAQPPRTGSPALRGDFGLKYPIRPQAAERQQGDTLRDRESDAQAMGSKTMVDLFLSSRRNQGDGRSSGFGSSPAAFL
ncbi:hypothetical protein J7337_001737 [Fusarium musae]|uniref:Uncharacterized protein n=1 Tax=Fusarium musae TaxID=1042133 RepID=A0A9P8IW82_9HYPO|nr:hypothetical protein J7337_001737 [Fusarium musae]KAG9508174.1 hypothetical protein J7337_001737 [Fusarium musae]